MERENRDHEAACKRRARRQRHSCPTAVGLVLLLTIASQACESKSGRGSTAQDAAQQDSAKKDAGEHDTGADTGASAADDAGSSHDMAADTGASTADDAGSSADASSGVCNGIPAFGAPCAPSGITCSYTTDYCAPAGCRGTFPGSCQCLNNKWLCWQWECFGGCPTPPGDAGAGGAGAGGAGTGGAGTGGMGTGGMGGGGGTGPGAGGHGGSTSVLGSCFEIFPSLQNAGPGASPVMFHVNPLDLNLGSVGVGASASATIGYFNFCSDMNAKVLGVELTETPAAGASGSSFAIEAAPAVGAAIWREATLKVTFTPKSAGPHEAIVRLRVTHGDYVTRIKGGG